MSSHIFTPELIVKLDESNVSFPCVASLNRFVSSMPDVHPAKGKKKMELRINLLKQRSLIEVTKGISNTNDSESNRIYKVRTTGSVRDNREK